MFNHEIRNDNIISGIYVIDLSISGSETNAHYESGKTSVAQ